MNEQERPSPSSACSGGLYGILGRDLRRLLSSLIQVAETMDRLVQVGHVTSVGEAGERVGPATVGAVLRDDSDDLDSGGLMVVEDGGTADPVNHDAVNQMSVRDVVSGADVAREEAPGPRLNGGVAEPADLGSNREGVRSWEEWKEVLRDCIPEQRYIHEDHRRVRPEVGPYYVLVPVEEVYPSLGRGDLNRLAPHPSVTQDVPRRSNPYEGLVGVLDAHEPSTVASGSFNLDNERRNALNCGLPVHVLGDAV